MITNRLALGTAQFGLKYGIANQAGQISFGEAGKILTTAKSLGINTIDTAIAYGESEQVLGKLGVMDWNVISKLPALPDNVGNVFNWVNSQVESSLARLDVNKFYAILLHRPDQLFGEHGKQLFEALERIKSNGFAGKIGVSVYSPHELERLYHNMHFDLVQAPLNILDRRFIESGWTRRLSHMGVELHTRSIFLQGLLLMTHISRPEKFNRWKYVWNEWEHWLRDNGLSPLEACLRYLLSIKEVDQFVIGVDSVTHLLEIQNASDGVLPNLPCWSKPIDNELINPSTWNSL